MLFLKDGIGLPPTVLEQTTVIGAILSPAIILIVLGALLRKYKKKRTAKILFILAGIYLSILIIGLGVCGSM